MPEPTPEEVEAGLKIFEAVKKQAFSDMNMALDAHGDSPEYRKAFAKWEALVQTVGETTADQARQWREELRASTIERWGPAVTDLLDLVKVTACDEDAEEHELETHPAWLGMLVLIQNVESYARTEI